MDILAHSLWSLALLPGPPAVEKVVFGIMPDLAVFLPALAYNTVIGKRQPRTRSRTEMMAWFDRQDNRWIKHLYRWTHSLVVWSLLLIPVFFLLLKLNGSPPWFLLATPLHILMDIPTHTHDSFPVSFLTPISAYRVNGFHWIEGRVLAANYLLLSTVILLRLFLLKY